MPRRGFIVVCALFGSAVFAACAEEPKPQPRTNATVVVMPDTQFYACGFPGIFHAQTEWILAHAAERNVPIVLHTGDVVDMDIGAQWQVAADSMHRLDGVVPYLIATGNHDMSTLRESMVASYFRPDELAAPGFAPEFQAPERIDNSYAIVSVSGHDWLFVGLEFAPRDAAVVWAADVLATHADVPAVLFTHAYLYADGQRYDRAVLPQQNYHPDSYGIPPEEGVNDGEDLWRKLVEPHENVKLVLSAHVIPDGTARSISTRASGSHVHELLANYQTCGVCPCASVEGGEGFLRLLEFDASQKRIVVTTYSPHLQTFLSDRDNEFVLELE